MSELVTKEVKVVVQKELYEIYECLGTIVEEIDKADDDGWQTMKDIPAVAMGSFGAIKAALDNIKEAGKGTEKEHLKGFIRTNVCGLGLLGDKVYGLIEDYLDKPEAPAEPTGDAG